MAACAPAATQAPAEAPEEPAEPAPVEKATVVYWDVSSPEAVDGVAKAAVADRFREKNPDIELEVSFKPTTGDTQMSETLITAIAAGNPPDAAYFDRFVVPTWAAEDSLTDLTDLAAGAGIKEDDYFPFAWEEASGWKDRLWSLPYDTDDRGLYYNKELVTAAGFDPEDMPVYAEDFDVLAEAMFEVDGSRMVTAGFIPWYNQGWLQTYGWSWDGKFWNKDTGEITANDPKIVASAEWVASYAEKYDITSFESFSSAFGSEAQNPFYTGQVAMMCTGNWELSSLAKYAPDLDFGVQPMPYPRDGGRVATWAGGWSVVVPGGAPNAEGGFRFISYFAGPEEMDFFCRETKHIPTLKAAAANAFYTDDPNHKVFMDMLPIANTRPPVPIGQFLWTALAEARDFIIHGAKTPQEALDDVTTNSNEEMKRYL
ncbi:MAG: ABC transporter substrate-binding protein [Anaerolineae bacterium]|nr:ABC transporter substrate-binding protein [Anaerolineae bacterium]